MCRQGLIGDPARDGIIPLTDNLKPIAVLSEALTPAALAVAPVFPEVSVAVVRAFAATAASAAGVSALSVVFCFRSHSVAPAADVPSPAAVGASAAPGPVSAEAVAAPAGISYPPSGFPCW